MSIYAKDRAESGGSRRKVITPDGVVDSDDYRASGGDRREDRYGDRRDDRRIDRREDRYSDPRRQSSRIGLMGSLFNELRPAQFSYGSDARNKEKNSFYEGWSQENAVKEDLRREAYDQAGRTLRSVSSQVFNRTGNFGQVIDDAMIAFTHPGGIKQKDRTLARFIDDLRSYNAIYVSNIATFIYITMVYTFAEHLYRYGKPIPPKELCDAIFHATIRLLQAEFGNWLLTSDDGWYTFVDMSNNAKRALERRDESIEAIRAVLQETADGTGEINNFQIPWKSDIIGLMSRSRPSTSPVTDEYLRNNGGHWTDDYFEGVTTPSVSSTVEDYRQPKSNWGESNNSLCDEMLDILSGRPSQSRPVNNASSGAFAFNDVWSDNEATPEPSEEPVRRNDVSITLDNFHQYDRSQVNYRKWFIEVPGLTDNYVIDPNTFAILAMRLKNVGNNADYCDGVRLLANMLPVVELDWDAGTYKYTLVKVKDKEDMDMKLTNPAEVIPLLETRSEEEILEEYRADIATMEELEAKRAAAAHDPNAVREMHSTPHIIYANKPITFNRRNGLNACVSALNNSVEKKFGKEAEVVALPFVDCAQLEMETVTMKEVRELLPFMVSGSEFTYTFEEFLEQIEVRLDDKIQNSPDSEDWKYLRQYIDMHFCTVINRWLVEERYYGATRKDKNFMAVKDLHEGGRGVLEELLGNDMPSYRVLQNMYKCATLVESMQMFASESEMEGFISTCSVESVDESIREEYKEEIMNTPVVATAAGVLVRINSAAPLDTDGPKVFQRSSNPEILHIIETAPLKVAKHFNRKVSVFVMFGRDISKTIWTATFSGESPDKVMLVPVRSSDSLALRKTLISEITFRRPGEEFI